ncbi:unnamed protein product [Ranitomeya imitator]|uniref:Uncharacterized protein n=1 Tax=Ranitomeya imitator TaxID=111125 RepID=A0ABN9L8K3_9NEOB|nr:unnamed protein product [Ranitomeya imitator]
MVPSDHDCVVLMFAMAVHKQIAALESAGCSNLFRNTPNVHCFAEVNEQTGLDKDNAPENAPTLRHLVMLTAQVTGWRPNNVTLTKSVPPMVLGVPGGLGIHVPPTALEKVLEFSQLSPVIEIAIAPHPL